MDLKTGIFAILAIFCLIVSAGAICAADFDGGYAGINYEDSNGVSGSQYYVHEEAVNGSNDQVQLEPGAGLPLENQSAPLPDNATNSTNTTNHTPAAGGEVQNATAPVQASAQALHATGNPILALLLVGAVLGGVQLYRRK